MWIYIVKDDCSISIEGVDSYCFEARGNEYTSLKQAKAAAKQLAKDKIADIKDNLKRNQKLSTKWMKYEATLKTYIGNLDNRYVQQLIDGLLNGVKPSSEHQDKALSILRERLLYQIYVEGYYEGDPATYTASDEAPTYLSYIQDRWQCAQRVYFLIKGLEDGTLVGYWCNK